MHRAIVLNIGPRADTDIVNVAADNGVEPNASLLAEHDIADDPGTASHKNRIGEDRLIAAKVDDLGLGHEVHGCSMEKRRITTETRLDELNIPCIELILDEIFSVPPARFFPEVVPPKTVAELAAQTATNKDEVIRKLRHIETLADQIEMDPSELAAALGVEPRPLLLDVRQPWEYEICHLPSSVLLCEEDFMSLLPKLAQEKLIVTICHHGMRSLSAAFDLRERGLRQVRSLVGGLDLWAKVMDPKMQRY